MASKTIEGLKADLDQWRGRLERLRVQANLGKKDARDKLRDLEDRLETAFDKAKRKLDEVAEDGATEAKVAVKSLRAGWKQVRKTHAELSRATKRKTAAASGKARG